MLYDGDLYISFKAGNRWSKPVNLGADLNTPYAEFETTIASAGGRQTMYFSRIRRGKPLVENIYVIENFDKFIELLRRAAANPQ